MDQINSFEQFREQVISDYKCAVLGAELRRAVCLDGNARNITACNDVAQVALARYIAAKDVVFASGVNLSLNLTRSSIDLDKFFQTHYSTASNNYELSQTFYLPRALGVAMAMSGESSENEQNIVMCTIDGCHANDGRFFEAISISVQRKLPICIVVWNTNDARTVGTLKRQLSGFSMVSKNGNALQVQIVRGGDFAALCHTFEQQTRVARQRECPSVTFVETDDDDLASMARWMSERKIAEEAYIQNVSAEIRQGVEAAHKKAYLGSLVSMAPIKPARRRVNVFDELARADSRVVIVDDEVCPVERAIGMSQLGKYPLVDAPANDVAMANWNGEKMLVRTIDYRLSHLLALSSEVEILLPATINQENEAVREACKNGRAAVVLPAFANDENISRNISQGAANVELNGNDAMIICFGRNVTPTIDAAKMLRQNKIECEVISLDSLQPFDNENIINKSIDGKQHLIVVDSERNGAVSTYILGKLAMSGALQSTDIHVIIPNNDGEPMEVAYLLSEVKRVLAPL